MYARIPEHVLCTINIDDEEYSDEEEYEYEDEDEHLLEHDCINRWHHILSNLLSPKNTSFDDRYNRILQLLGFSNIFDNRIMPTEEVKCNFNSNIMKLKKLIKFKGSHIKGFLYRFYIATGIFIMNHGFGHTGNHSSISFPPCFQYNKSDPNDMRAVIKTDHDVRVTNRIMQSY